MPLERFPFKHLEHPKICFDQSIRILNENHFDLLGNMEEDSCIVRRSGSQLVDLHVVLNQEQL